MIGLKGIRLAQLNLTMKNGQAEITGTYQLVSTTDKILANQHFNGYDELKISMSGPTLKALDAFLGAYKSEITTMIGLDGEQT